MHLSWQRASLPFLLLAPNALAIDLNVNDAASLRSAAKTIVPSIIQLYDPTVPGLLQQPYYWWEAGLTYDALINYWALTNDSSYVDLTHAALTWQMGSEASFMPANQTKDEGNDDQTTWALAAMTAAERGFPAPSANLSWARIAQNVFDQQAARWDDGTCGGGLRWQIFTFNAGYNYKNALSNGNFMQLAGRLARYTGNQTYADWAQRTLQWTYGIGLIQNGTVYDGTSVVNNCTDFSHTLWTSNFGTVLSASSYMANYTQDQLWSTLASSVFDNARSYFASNSTPNVLTEVACQPQSSCVTDQLAFRAILARALASQLALSTNDSDGAAAILQASAAGAAAQCVEHQDSLSCGSDWSSTTWDGTYGVGQSVSALEVILANLPQPALLTADSAGTATSGTASGPGNATMSSPAAMTSSPHVNAAAMQVGSMFAVMGGLGLAALL
nr:mannan endo-1,6-alpha-mannosidase dcw1 [Quercus suber]